MSGHSKWSQIKHKKALTDKKKSSLFGKLAKAISVAAKDNPDPSTNIRLKSAIEQARSFDMPNDNITRLLKKAAEKDSQQLHEVLVEAFGPGGVGLIITAITDNKNRTIGDIRTLLSKNGATMGGQGSVMWMFHKEGSGFTPLNPLPLSQSDKDQLAKLVDLLDDLDDVQDIYSNESDQ